MAVVPGMFSNVWHVSPFVSEAGEGGHPGPHKGRNIKIKKCLGKCPAIYNCKIQNQDSIAYYLTVSSSKINKQRFSNKEHVKLAHRNSGL